MTKEKWFLTCMSNASIKCRSLTREKKIDEGTHTRYTNMQTKIIVIWTMKKIKWNKTKWITLIILKTVMMTIITIR